MTDEQISLGEHLEVVLREKDRAIEMATEEREKAASALRLEMERAVREGDERLREHISNQIMQIQSALESAEKLEVTRFDALQNALAAVVREQEALRLAQRDAQLKFERSVESRFTQVNEFRGSLDDLSKQMATRRELETGLSTALDGIEKARQERQHQIEDLRATLAELRSRLDVGAPQIPELQAFVASNLGKQEQKSEGRAQISSTTAIIGTVIAVIAFALALLVGRNSGRADAPPSTVTVTQTVPTP